MSDYTPKTAELRKIYVDSVVAAVGNVNPEEMGEEFDRWVASLQREEPSDAQVEAAARAVEKIPYTSSFYVTRIGARELAVAALRAAAEIRNAS